MGREHLFWDWNFEDSVEPIFSIEVGTELPHETDRQRNGKEALNKERMKGR